MNNEHLLKILKHNLEVMPSRIYCPVVESENIGGAYREGYEQALDDVKGQVEGIIEDEEITWLTGFDTRIDPGYDYTSSLETFDGPTKPWLRPKMEDKESVKAIAGDPDYWHELRKQVEELDEKYHTRLDEVIEQFLDERGLTWEDFKSHSKLEISHDPHNKRVIYWNDEPIIVTFQKSHEENNGWIVSWKIVPLFETTDTE